MGDCGAVQCAGAGGATQVAARLPRALAPRRLGLTTRALRERDPPPTPPQPHRPACSELERQREQQIIDVAAEVAAAEAAAAEVAKGELEAASSSSSSDGSSASAEEVRRGRGHLRLGLLRGGHAATPRAQLPLAPCVRRLGTARMIASCTTKTRCATFWWSLTTSRTRQSTRTLTRPPPTIELPVRAQHVCMYLWPLRTPRALQPGARSKSFHSAARPPHHSCPPRSSSTLRAGKPTSGVRTSASPPAGGSGERVGAADACSSSAALAAAGAAAARQWSPRPRPHRSGFSRGQPLVPCQKCASLGCWRPRPRRCPRACSVGRASEAKGA